MYDANLTLAVSLFKFKFKLFYLKYTVLHSVHVIVTYVNVISPDIQRHSFDLGSNMPGSPVLLQRQHGTGIAMQTLLT